MDLLETPETNSLENGDAPESEQAQSGMYLIMFLTFAVVQLRVDLM